MSEENYSTSGSNLYLILGAGLAVAFLICAVAQFNYRQSSVEINQLVDQLVTQDKGALSLDMSSIPESAEEVLSARLGADAKGTVQLSSTEGAQVASDLLGVADGKSYTAGMLSYLSAVLLASSAGFLCAFFMMERIQRLKIQKTQLETHSKRQTQSILKAKRYRDAVEKKLKGYQSVLNRTKENEQKLKDKITEADQVEKELKQFVDIQIQTNEQLLIAETQLKNLLEKEKESKSIINQTLDRLKETQGQLVHSEKMASLGQLTAGIAHEINNPVNFIYNGIGSLKTSLDELSVVVDKYEELEGTDNLNRTIQELKVLKAELEFDQIKQDLSELILDIKEGAVRTIEIVKGLRVFSRLDEEDSKQANINECLDATVVLLKNKMKNRIQLNKELDPSLPDINCYPGQLNQVFMNILTNAIQAIPEEQKDACITVRTVDMEDRIEIALGDNGTGMSEDVKRRIFEPFFTTKPVGVGTGLGMSISYGIIEKHKGSMSVNSELGKGSEFIISLPKESHLILPRAVTA